MGYCFMHVDKIKSFAQMKNEYTHNYRLVEVANANPQLSIYNEELVSLNGKSYEDSFNDTLVELRMKNGAQKNMRSNGVYGFDIMMSLSQEDIGKVDIEEWKKANVEWLKKTFNPPEIRNKDGNIIYTENVKSVVFHADEVGGPHIHAFVIPVDDKGKINASYYDGPGKYREHQSSYAKAMEKFGLSRGLENSVAKHNDIKRYYSALNKIVNAELPEPLPNENLTEYRLRANEEYQNAMLKNMGEQYRLRRELVEAKTEIQSQNISKQSDLIQKSSEIKKLKNEFEHEQDKLYRTLGIEKENVEDDLGLVRSIRNEIQETKDIKKAIETYPDKSLTNDFKKNYEMLLAWQQQQNRKEKRKKIGKSKDIIEKQRFDE